MQWPQTVKDLLERIVAVPPVTGQTAEGPLNALSSSLARLDSELREQIQAVTAAQVSALIEKLKADGPVGPADLEVIRLWMVGDAEYYVQMEKDLPAWLTELDRLIGVLRQLRAEAMTPATMGRMQATIRDALRVTSDIVFYRQQEERVRTFQTTTKSLSREDKRTLAGILAQKFGSELI